MARRDAKQRALDRVRMFKMLGEGMTQSMIAEELGVSVPRISMDFKLVMKQVANDLSYDSNQLRQNKLLELGRIKYEAWAAWHRSKNDSVKNVKETYGGRKRKNKETGEEEDVPPQVKKIRSKEGRIPASEYLNIILKCIEQERELMGLDPQKELHVKGQISWDEFSKTASVAANRGDFDQVERELNAMIENPARGAIQVKVIESPSNGQESSNGNGHVNGHESPLNGQSSEDEE